MRILVVEDEASLAKQLTSSIAEAGYAVDHAADGERADFLVQTELYDAMVLDLGLPKIDGLTLLRNWREAGLATPVLVLTARGSWHDKVRGIDGGADDYVSKPFRIEEVLARLRALIRRKRPPHAGASRGQRGVGSAAIACHAGRRAGEAHGPRVPRPLLPDAPSRTRRLSSGAH